MKLKLFLLLLLSLVISHNLFGQNKIKPKPNTKTSLNQSNKETNLSIEKAITAKNNVEFLIKDGEIWNNELDNFEEKIIFKNNYADFYLCFSSLYVDEIAFMSQIVVTDNNKNQWSKNFNLNLFIRNTLLFNSTHLNNDLDEEHLFDKKSGPIYTDKQILSKYTATPYTGHIDINIRSFNHLKKIVYESGAAFWYLPISYFTDKDKYDSTYTYQGNTDPVREELKIKSISMQQNITLQFSNQILWTVEDDKYFYGIFVVGLKCSDIPFAADKKLFLYRSKSEYLCFYVQVRLKKVKKEKKDITKSSAS